VFLGNGDGTFNTTAPTILTPAAGSYVSDIVVMDVNGDGIPDIVAAYYGNTMQIWKGLGNGTFTGMTAVSTGFSGNNWVSSLEVGDINNDGTLDFIFTQYQSSTWGMLQGNTGTGSGTTGAATQFSGPSTTTGLVWNAVRLVDWNLDGQLDVMGFKQNVGAIFYNSTGSASCGSGSFTAPTQSWLTGNPGGSPFYEMPAIIDLNGDGYPDILNANAAGSNQDASIGVMYNYSSGATTH